MKKIISILLILLYSTVLFIPLNPVIHYVLHKKYYTEVLCVNKDKPMMHCNGKCHLKKEINEINKEQNNTDNPNKPVPLPKTGKEKYPVLLNIDLDSKETYYYGKNWFIDYILPFMKDIYPDIITPPPEFKFVYFQ